MLGVDDYAADFCVLSAADQELMLQVATIVREFPGAARLLNSSAVRSMPVEQVPAFLLAANHEKGVRHD